VHLRLPLLRFVSIPLLLLALAVPFSAAAQETLIISEYVEGTGFNRALELFNTTGETVDLAADGYVVEIYHDGSAAVGASIALSGSVPSQDVFVLVHASADSAALVEADLTSSSLDFNGNDAVVLRHTAGVVDVLGQVGFDPGTEWGTGDTSTRDNTLRRNAELCTGDPDGSDAFDPSLEWDGYPTDTFSGLGGHSAVCKPVPAREATWGGVKVIFQ
jgi:predicted extracellular nuclease